MAGLRPGLDQPAGLELQVGLEHGGDAHPLALGQPAHRGQAISGPQGTDAHRFFQLSGDAFVETELLHGLSLA